MTTQYTPAPYFIDGDGLLKQHEGAYRRVATLVEPRSSDARLIAASPDLLEALKAAHGNAAFSPSVLELVEAAIARAEGRDASST